MSEKHYKLRFISLFEDDLNSIVDYITVGLQNQTAADMLVDDVQQAIHDRLPYAESFEHYYSLKTREYPYYRIYVKNYTVYYVVIGDTMEVRRILYNKRAVSEEI